MCGFAGFLQPAGILLNDGHRRLADMGSTLVHRGPDDSGVWCESESGVGMVHRRLSILDLTRAGHQPMSSSDDRFTIAFNGEIYNHLLLRKMLEKGGQVPAWRGHSDTETLLAAISAWGVERALRECVGMFAFALWDREQRALILARDRFGEKPLYYGWQGNLFLFGSELKALRAHPSFLAEIDRAALSLFLRHNAIPSPHSIYQGIHKLPPATWLTIRAGGSQAQPQSYWSLRDVAERGQTTQFGGSADEAVQELERLLRQAVADQMVSDVPLGAFLSGGVDSSAVVALMQAQSSRPVKTFSIGFHEAGYNEAEHAKAVAQHLGTDHAELYVTPREAMAVIPRLPAIYDEPFSDSSQIPTFLVAQMARRHVTVALSGDAGDESFGGYTRYLRAQSLWTKLNRLPRSIRHAAAKAIRGIPLPAWDAAGRPFMPLLPGRYRQRPIGDRAYKLAELLTLPTPEQLYHGLVSHWKDPGAVVIGGAEPSTAFTDPNQWPGLAEFEHRMMYLDTVNYLPDDILVKVDRAAMAVSLETRVPLLDHRVVEFAWRLPLSMKIRQDQGKWILRQVLYKYVPRELIERPKMGFGVPIDAWLRGPLRDWAESLLDEARLHREGFFHPGPIRQKWREHLTGTRNWQYYLWDVLMFQAWLEHQGESMVRP